MPDLRPLLRAIARPAWGRVARAVAVVAFVGVVATTCGDAPGEWSWVDSSSGSHIAAINGRVVATVASNQRSRQLLALPPGSQALVALLVLVGLLRSFEHTHRPTLRALGPPRRGPPRALLAGAPA
jgi:hypothetical protein